MGEHRLTGYYYSLNDSEKNEYVVTKVFIWIGKNKIWLWISFIIFSVWKNVENDLCFVVYPLEKEVLTHKKYLV